jgi:hypothetical protein
MPSAPYLQDVPINTPLRLKWAFWLLLWDNVQRAWGPPVAGGAIQLPAQEAP